MQELRVIDNLVKPRVIALMRFADHCEVDLVHNTTEVSEDRRTLIASHEPRAECLNSPIQAQAAAETLMSSLRNRSLFQAVLNKMRWCAKQTVGAEGNPCWRLMLAWVEEQVAKSPEPERTIPVWRLEHLINTAYGTAKDDAEFGLQIRSLLKNEPGLEPRANGEVFKLQNQLDVARSEVALLRKEACDAWDKCEERRQEGIAFQLTARELRERLEEADMKIGSLHKRILEIGERKGEVNAVNTAERRKS